MQFEFKNFQYGQENSRDKRPDNQPQKTEQVDTTHNCEEQQKRVHAGFAGHQERPQDIVYLADNDGPQPDHHQALDI